MILPRFELHQPASVREAVELAARLAPDFDFVAGGTDLLQNYKNRLNPKPHVVSLARVGELRELTPRRVGALVTLAELESSELVQKELAVVAQAASKVASPLIRQTATVGGNLLVETRCFYFNQSRPWRASKGFCMKAEGDNCLVVPQKERCYATFSGDLAPAFIVLGARVKLVSASGEREVELARFYDGDGIKRHVLRAGEMIASVEVPEPPPGLRAQYRKLRLRDAFDYPEMGLAVSLVTRGGCVESLRIVATAVDTVPLVFDKLTSAVSGRPLSDELVEVLAERVMKAVTPVKNTALSPNYRRRMVGVFLRRMLGGARGET